MDLFNAKISVMVDEEFESSTTVNVVFEDLLKCIALRKKCIQLRQPGCLFVFAFRDGGSDAGGRHQSPSTKPEECATGFRDP